MRPSVQQPISKDKNVMARARKYYLKNNYLTLRSKVITVRTHIPHKYYFFFFYLTLRSKSHKGHCGMQHTALWSCTHIHVPNKYYLKNKYLTLRSKDKVPRRSLRYATHHHIPNIIDLSRKTKMLWPGQENTI